MHHRLKWFIRVRAQGLRKGDEHLVYTVVRGMARFTITGVCIFCLPFVRFRISRYGMSEIAHLGTAVSVR